MFDFHHVDVTWCDKPRGRWLDQRLVGWLFHEHGAIPADMCSAHCYWTTIQAAVEGMEVSSETAAFCQQKLRFLRNVLQNCPSVSRAKFFLFTTKLLDSNSTFQTEPSFMYFMSGHEILFSGKVLWLTHSDRRWLDRHVTALVESRYIATWQP